MKEGAFFYNVACRIIQNEQNNNISYITLQLILPFNHKSPYYPFENSQDKMPPFYEN